MPNKALEGVMQFMKRSPEKKMLKQLRKLGGEWVVKQTSYGTFVYRGDFIDADWFLAPHEHIIKNCENMFDFEVRWQIYRNGVLVCFPTENPLWFLADARTRHEGNPKQRQDDDSAGGSDAS